MSIAINDRVELVNVSAGDVGKNGRTLARFDPQRGSKGTVAELFSDGHGLRSVLVKLDRPNIGELWVRPSQVRPCANGEVKE